jgi:hypothetical protein
LGMPGYGDTLLIPNSIRVIPREGFKDGFSMEWSPKVRH